MSETFPAQGPVKVKILGKETKEKEEAGERVKADMNYELTERMVEYRPEHERMLYSLGLAGSAFKKVYFDPMQILSHDNTLLRYTPRMAVNTVAQRFRRSRLGGLLGGEMTLAHWPHGIPAP